MNGTGVLRRVASTASCRQLSSENNGLMGPAVKLLLNHYGLSRRDVNPTGPKNNVLKGDVMHVIQSRNLKPMEKLTKAAVDRGSNIVSAHKGSKRSIGGYHDIPLTNMRRTIAKRLSQSKQNIPHEYMSASVIWDGVAALRKQLKEDGIAISVNDVIIKAVANSLTAVPLVNVAWIGDAVVAHHSVDISVAVSTPTGLITPIIFNADTKGIIEISKTVRDLAAKAKENRLTPNQFQGGTFTISNLGMFGSVTGFTAIINEPQAAILTVGSPVYEINEMKKTESRCTLTLCYDGRAISSSTAQQFISYLSQSLDQPILLITAPHFSHSINDDQFDYARLL
ncbi:hypothetical protein PENTCL1PPCAC_17774 [Pristionchus entomophagus]|uniref:2-oxoacid dehydrogenase acyltransferase catalytic domain-containing protein n=1 Tax=Pristionchus entomophagus TaxID=358040 RepID=A0AAV5TMT3_9BILA|nr:hypothetical protein PENTCL1PPCAC_17774 [Pristionchus entomophagus]